MRRSAFTLIELLIVVAAIAVLAGLLLPAVAVIRTQNMKRSTQAVVQLVATAIEQYQQTQALLVAYRPTGALGAAEPWQYFMWDVLPGPLPTDHDRIIDGDPLLERPSISTPGDPLHPVWQTGYRGLIATTGIEVPHRHRDPVRGRVLDSWDRPLRILWRSKVFGATPFGVWSVGKDGVDGVGSDGVLTAGADDLVSWSH